MTGIEALSLLKDGKTLRRESWEPHEKCKALDFFGLFDTIDAGDFLHDDWEVVE